MKTGFDGLSAYDAHKATNTANDVAMRSLGMAEDSYAENKANDKRRQNIRF